MIARGEVCSQNDYKKCTHIMIARRAGLFRNSDRTVPWTGALNRAVKYQKYYDIIMNMIIDIHNDALDRAVENEKYYDIIINSIFNTGVLDKAVKYGAC